MEAPPYYLSKPMESRAKPPEHSKGINLKQRTPIVEQEVKGGNKSIKIMAVRDGIPKDGIWSVKGKALITTNSSSPKNSYSIRGQLS